MAIIEQNLGKVKGDNYNLTELDKTEIAGLVELTSEDDQRIADIVGTNNYLRKSIINVDVYNESASQYPESITYVVATITLKDSNGVTITTFPTNSQRVAIRVPQYSVYKLSVTAAGYGSVAEQTVNSVDGDVTVGFALTPTTDVYYDVLWKNGDTILFSERVRPHESSTYQGDDPTAEGKVFSGWDKSATDIIANTTINAVFIEPSSEAPEVKDLSLYDYILSDVEGDTSAYTKEEFAYIMLNNLGKTYFEVGKSVNIKLGSEWTYSGDLNLVVDLVAFNHFRRSDNNQFALTSWLMKGVLATGKRINATSTNAGGFEPSELNGFMQNTLFNQLPPYWRSLIKSVKVGSTVGSQSIQVEFFNAKLWLANRYEVFGTSAGFPYDQEIDADAENKQFAIFTTTANRIKKTYNGLGSASYWWLRSPSTDSASSFRAVGDIGFDISVGATGANYLALGFCI